MVSRQRCLGLAIVQRQDWNRGVVGVQFGAYQHAVTNHINQRAQQGAGGNDPVRQQPRSSSTPLRAKITDCRYSGISKVTNIVLNSS